MPSDTRFTLFHESLLRGTGKLLDRLSDRAHFEHFAVAARRQAPMAAAITGRLRSSGLGTDRRFAALHNSGSSTPTSGRDGPTWRQADCCSRHRHKGLASVRVQRDDDATAAASHPDCRAVLIQIVAPYRLSSASTARAQK
jgi:hypothetical protein